MGRYRDQIVLTDELGFEEAYPTVEAAAHAAVEWYQEFYNSIENDPGLSQDVLSKVLAIVNSLNPKALQTAPELDAKLNGMKIQLIRLLAPAWGISMKQANEEGWLVVHHTTLGYWAASTRAGKTTRRHAGLSEQIVGLEEREALLENAGENALIGGLKLLRDVCDLLNVDLSKLDELNSDESGFLYELFIEWNSLEEAAQFAEKAALLFRKAVRNSKQYNEVHGDLMEFYDEWDRLKKREKEMTNLPGAPEARDYQQVQSAARRRHSR